MSVSGKKTKRTTADKVPPTGKWVQRTPHAGSTVSGTIYLDLLAIDNRGMSFVQFFLNGAPLGTGSVVLESSQRGGIYTYSFDTNTYDNGAYNVSAYLAPNSGPGMTKNLGTLIISNTNPISLRITNLADNEVVTLPFDVYVQVDNSTASPGIDGDGAVESDPVEVSPGYWKFTIDTFYESDVQVLPLTPRLVVGDQVISGRTVTVLNRPQYGDVSVSYALSGTSLNLGDTLTITPSFSGDDTDVTVRYDFDGDSSFDTSNTGGTLSDPVSYAYPLIGTYTPRAVIEREGITLQADNLGPVTVSPVITDTIAPSVSVATPANGATVSGTLSYTFAVSDAGGVTGVVPVVNGVNQALVAVSPPSTSTTVTASLDTTAYSEGALTIAGTAYDAAGNSATSPTIVVTVDNIPDPPPVEGGVARWTMTTSFGTIRQSTGSCDRKLRVYNASDTDTLSTSSLSLPTGFSLVDTFPTSIAPLEWADCTIRMADSTAGTKDGNITFSSSDPNASTVTIAVTGAVAATGTEVLLATETRRNKTGSALVKAPIRVLLRLEPGELPTTETLVLRLNDGTLVATTHWQWGERSTHEDGSLRACVIRYYGPASWTNDTDFTVKVYKAAGAWPAETNARTITDITANSDREIRFKDVRKVYDSAAAAANVFLSQPAIGSGEFYNSLNDDLADTPAYKRTAGAICTQWYWFSRSRDLSTNADDADLKVMGWVEAWIDPDDSNAVKWICWEPIISNGQWSDSGLRSRSVLYELEVYEAGVSIRNWKRSLARTGSHVAVGSHRVETGTNSFPSMSWGVVCKFSGTPPSNITTGKYYPFRNNGTLGTGKAISVCDIANPNSPGPWGCSSGQTLVSFADAGTTFTIDCAVMHPMGRSYPLREDDGFEHWIMTNGSPSTGAGPKIVPNWSEAQILERQRRGQLMPITLYNLDGTLATQATADRNVSFTANYAPWTILWMPCAQTLGYKNAFDGGSVDQYTGESTSYGVDVLRGMTSLPHHTQLRIGGADWPRFTQIRWYDVATNPLTGRPYNRIKPSNDGPNKAGASYTGLGAPLNTVRCGDGAAGTWNSYYANVQSHYYGANTYSDGHVLGGGDSTHTSPANIENFAFYASPVDWHYCVMSATHGIQWLSPGLNTAGGRDRSHLGTRYYHVTAVADAPHSLGSARANGQILRLIAGAILGPDSEPEVPFFQDIAADNCDYLELATTTSSIIGPVHKAMGIAVATIEEGGGGAGSQQGWWMARVLVGTQFLYKAMGRLDTDALDYMSNCIMGVAGRKRSGPGRVVQAKPHLLSAGLAWVFLRCSSSNGALAGCLDDSRHIVTDGWSAMNFAYGSLTNLYFQTDSLIRFREQVPDVNIAAPLTRNGDSFYLRKHAASTPPSGVSINTYYYLFGQVPLSRYARIRVTGGTVSVGNTITQGANTAVVTTATPSGSDYLLIFSAPTPGPFVDGPVSFSSGASGTFVEANAQNYDTTYKICTDYADTNGTRVTWSIATEDLEQRVSVRFTGLGRGVNNWAMGPNATADYICQQFNPAACAYTWFRRKDVAPIFDTYREMLLSRSGFSKFDGGTYRQNYYQILG